MVNLKPVFVLFIVGVILAGARTWFIQDKDFLFASPLQEEYSKIQDYEEKEKLEQNLVEPGFTFSIYPGTATKHTFDFYWYILSCHEERDFPPPEYNV